MLLERASVAYCINLAVALIYTGHWLPSPTSGGTVQVIFDRTNLKDTRYWSH
jgi:hypothetical protein